MVCPIVRWSGSLTSAVSADAQTGFSPGRLFEAPGPGQRGRLRHNGSLSPRRVLFAAAVLLALAALLSSLSPREERAVAPSRTEQDAAARRPAAHGRPAGLPADKVVRAREGDVVDLEVMSAQPDEARIDDLGVSGPAGPGLPADLRFVADQAGRFPVTLRDSGERVGTLERRPGTR